ncbi:hypothetical protein PR048_015806 [Dryococelus australis]|uniref:Uncharacterized protein n=1 Tax=Dryococelus australis TaxID=614101 RepID=A0ABQ9HHY9_9NEOP|nr:hypothetical protein PR048_015806 [Dryococelus australis]
MLAQSSSPTVTADNQCTVDIDKFVRSPTYCKMCVLGRYWPGPPGSQTGVSQLSSCVTRAVGTAVRESCKGVVDQFPNSAGEDTKTTGMQCSELCSVNGPVNGVASSSRNERGSSVQSSSNETLLSQSSKISYRKVHLPGRVTTDFRIWESCRTMPLVAGFHWGNPVSPAISFQHCSIRSSITLIGFQDLDFKSRPNLFIQEGMGDRSGGMACRHVADPEVSERLAHSPPTKANRVKSSAGSSDLRKWESCRTMPLVGGFSRFIFTLITLIGSPDLAVKSRLNLFSHSPRRISDPESEQEAGSRSPLTHTHPTILVDANETILISDRHIGRRSAYCYTSLPLHCMQISRRRLWVPLVYPYEQSREGPNRNGSAAGSRNRNRIPFHPPYRLQPPYWTETSQRSWAKWFGAVAAALYDVMVAAVWRPSYTSLETSLLLLDILLVSYSHLVGVDVVYSVLQYHAEQFHHTVLVLAWNDLVLQKAVLETLTTNMYYFWVLWLCSPLHPISPAKCVGQPGRAEGVRAPSLANPGIEGGNRADSEQGWTAEGKDRDFSEHWLISTVLFFLRLAIDFPPSRTHIPLFLNLYIPKLGALAHPGPTSLKALRPLTSDSPSVRFGVAYPTPSAFPGHNRSRLPPTARSVSESENLSRPPPSIGVNHYQNESNLTDRSPERTSDGANRSSRATTKFPWNLWIIHDRLLHRWNEGRSPPIPESHFLENGDLRWPRIATSPVSQPTREQIELSPGVTVHRGRKPLL